MSFLRRFLQGLGPRQTEQERRQNGRLPAHGQVLLMWQNTRQQPRRADAHIIETSSAGMSIVARRAVPAGREALITNGRIALSCIVRHCDRKGRECTMGLEIVSRDELPEDSPFWHPFGDVEL